MSILKCEREFISNNHFQLFRLANLHHWNEKMFYEVCKFLPLGINVNRRSDLFTLYTNKAWVDWVGQVPALNGYAIEKVLELSDKKVSDIAFRKIRQFSHIDDHQTVCSYFQRILSHEGYNWYLSNKLFLDESTYLNLSYNLNALGLPGRYLKEVLGDSEEAPITKWEKFQSLTKREKEILMLVANGKNSQEIGDKLFISKFTVQTHRKNILQKIDTKNIHELIRFAEALELIELK